MIVWGDDMLYKVILVEDETIIREGMEQFVNWNELGFQIVASLSDGKEALDFLEENEVDLIITDIEMTYVSGLALAKYIYEKNISTKIVLLTAYSSFEYISEGMKYKVVDYILKTTQTAEIEMKLQNIFNQLEEERFKNERNSMLENLASNALPYLKEQFLKEFISGYIKTEEEIKKSLKRSGVNVDLYATKVSLYILEYVKSDNKILSDWKYGYEGFCNVIRNFFDGFDQTRLFFYLISDNVFILEISNSNSEVGGIQTEFSSLFTIDIKLKLIAGFENIFEITQDKINELGLKNFLEENKEISKNYIIGSVLSYIDNHINDDITLERVSKSVYVSSEYLSRLFKKEVGLNFKEYVIKCKMTKAMELLKDPKYKVYEISEILGYKSVGFFSKVFREYTKFSPTEYRNKEL